MIYSDLHKLFVSTHLLPRAYIGCNNGVAVHSLCGFLSVYYWRDTKYNKMAVQASIVFNGPLIDFIH